MKRILCGMALMATLGAPVFADLNNFRDDVEKQEQDKPADPAPSPAPEPAPQAPDGSDCSTVACNVGCNLGMQVCSNIDWVGIGSSWAQGNASVRYSDYPWSDNAFVHAPLMGQQNQSSPFTFRPGPGKPRWYEVQTGYQMLKGMGSGAEISFRGQFNGVVGPDAEALWITDGSQWFVASRAGVRMPMFQSDPLSITLYGRVDVWSGVLNRTGGDFGIEWRSLPFKPLDVTVRTGMQVFPKFVLADEEVRAGMCVGPLEIQGGWTWWNLLGNGDVADTYQGPYLGFSFHW